MAVRTPDTCPPNSRVLVTSKAEIEAANALQDVRSLDLDVISDEIAAAAEELVSTLSQPPVSMTLGPETRTSISNSLATGVTKVVQQKVSGTQVIANIIAPICNLTLDNNFVVSLMTDTMADTAVDAVLRSPEYAAVEANMPSSPTIDTATTPVVPEQAPPPTPAIDTRLVLFAIGVAVFLLIVLVLVYVVIKTRSRRTMTTAAASVPSKI